ncbi:MAG: DUF3048 domain-containing protein [Candidatus Kerfeldbacteria bacterium CG08_land_8_20_14_0_20_40_16]|uniref:DUF3048 domain-containing protein n=1 Tax=Candidatus Kerfeldbacteria bacterium CG08_land_8_20_14_0_20_40_16 TaxID=2014244 RepID=A0A2H0YWU9_9BACT|nr:MAG: DUF3048 domain-containing protein [Candidatus Kerfeldbacteria bacterium CG08_land_8_20_14_0_20_40_16]
MSGLDRFKKFFDNRNTKIGLLVIAVLIAAVVVGYFLFSKQNIDLNGNNDSKATGNKVARLLDGFLVDRGSENIYPVAVMVENLSTIRPQSGLDQAGVVYEALAEGGITRFLAIYSTNEAIAEIGPVRSARDYYLDWVSEYNALYTHCGGSPSALKLIKEYNLLNLDQIGGDHPYFWRDSSRATASEHTLFTSSELLTYARRDKGIPEEGNFKSWLFKEEVSLAERPTETKKITIDYSTFSYKVEYQYDRNNNQYLRFNGGEPHLDFKTQKQLTVKNVIVQYVKTRLADTSRLSMEAIGEGGALVFQDGEMINATWKKENREARTIFYNSTGEEIKLNSGPTWIEVVPTDRSVEYD